MCSSPVSADGADDGAGLEGGVDIALELRKGVDCLNPEVAVGSVEEPPKGIFGVVGIYP